VYGARSLAGQIPLEATMELGDGGHLNDQTIRQHIADILAAEGHGNGSVTAETALSDGGLELSSLELVRLLVSLEERLGISFDDETILNARFNTVDDIISVVVQSA
jgi:acyl carrier protein